ncbi:MAG: hypothetical protein QM541_09265 [Flavobacterium sp.]|nr:hypothetical protein [Flavobacterium sp.]
MKFFLSIFIIALFSWLLGLISFLPWYSFVAVAFIVSVLFRQKPIASFLSGFLALFFVWIILSLVKDIPNEHLLSSKVASILPFKGNYTVLLIVTGFIGGLLGGFGSLTASFVKKD